MIDYKKINSDKILVHYTNFSFENISLFIGYKYDLINDFINKNSENDPPIIDIANILIINYENDSDNFLVNKQEENFKNLNDMDSITEYFLSQKNEKYFNLILAEICFNLGNIKIINSKYIEKTSSIFDKYKNNDEEKNNKYIYYIDIFAPELKEQTSKFYMCSLNKNIEEYFSINYIFFAQNLNKLFFQNIFREELNIILSSSNFIFIDFLLGFFYDIDKRRELLEENDLFNNEQKINILNDEFIGEVVLIIFEIIFSIKNEKILKYYFSDSDKNNILIRIKIFFINNIYLLNNKIFLNKFFELLSKKKEYFLIFSTNIFLELNLFSTLSIPNQNFILFSIDALFDKKKEEMKDIDPLYKYYLEISNKGVKLNPLMLEKLLVQLINITLYYPLSNEELKEDNNENRIEIILNIIKIILKINQKNQYTKIFNSIKVKIQNYINTKENHNLETFFEKNKNILIKSNSIINNEIIKNQLDLLKKAFKEFIESLTNNGKHNLRENSEKELNDPNSLEINNNINDKQKNNNINKLSECNFCQYLKDYFNIKINEFFGELKYEKEKNIFYRYIFLNFKEYRQKIGTNKYAWFITGKESCHCVQNKFFIKENNIKLLSPLKRKNQFGNLYSYSYNNNLTRFKKLSLQLQRIFCYDKISIDNHFINYFKGNNNFIFENCLLINRLYKTFSLFILQNEYIIILTNIFIDRNNQLNVSFCKSEICLWFIKNEEYLIELDKYIQNNENEFKKIFEGKKEEDNNGENETEFGINKDYKFSFKRFKISEISEMYKTSFLQVPNSIEIITNKGKRYFLCFNIDKRDNVFYSILEAISNKYSNNGNKKNNKKLITTLKKSYKSDSNEIFYMKNFPTYFCNIISNKSQKIIKSTQKIRFNKKDPYNKIIIEKSALINELISYWAKNKISNFDYLMILNILAERSLINLSQYIIFPLIICSIEEKFFMEMNKSIFRDLSFPIFACQSSLTNDFSALNSKVVSNDNIGDIYHSGIFYSTYAFVAYYLVRQHPFTELHLEIQGGEFDTAERLFIGKKELFSLVDKHQEIIPALFTLPELYLNTNNYLLGSIKKNSKEEKLSQIVSDFTLPNWANDDQRKFTFYLKKLLESKNVSQNLHSWFDLIFGYKMEGDEAIKSYNTYRKACYEFTKEEIEKAYKEGTLFAFLFEKLEMGYMGKQIFKKQHKKKEVLTEGFKEYENSFLYKINATKNIKLKKLNIEIKSNKSFTKINDILINTTNDYIKYSLQRNSYYFQGGISSLKSVMNKLSNESNNQSSKNITFQKLINAFENESKFIILNKKCILLGDNFNKIILNYNKKIIKITYICSSSNVNSFYYLNESGNISVIISNKKGSKLYIGFDNGNIIPYKIKVCETDKNSFKENDYIYPFKILIEPDKEKNNNNKKNKKNNENEQTPIIILQKIVYNNNFIRNNIHIPSKIRKLNLDEKNNVLIALTVTNIIYIISLNNNFKLMNTISYFSHFDYNFKIKDILTFADNGDFIIYSSLSVHLFNINGVPLCELNLLKENYDIAKITYCLAVFIDDIILLTGHKDGSIIFWKMKTKKNDTNKKFLSEYYYNYTFDFDITNIKNYELRRKFEIISKIKYNDDIKVPIKYMNISNDMNYMLIIDKNKNVFILTGKVDEDNSKTEKKVSQDKNKDEEKLTKNICKICKKEYKKIISDINNNEKLNHKINGNEIKKELDFELDNKNEIINKINKENTEIEDENICDICKNKFDNYLYNF